MPRPWGKLHAPMLSHRKYIRMTRAERGDWLTLLLAAINSTKDDDLGTPDDVKSILRSFGNARPADTIAQFVNLGLLDERISDGHLLLHDWTDHQPDDPTGAKRKAAERKAAKAAAGGTDVTGQSQDSPVTVAGQSADIPQPVAGQSSDLSRERAREMERRGEETRDSPQPPASGGRRSNGTSQRQVAAQAKAEQDDATRAKAYRRNERKLAYLRGAITDEQQQQMDQTDAPLSTIPDWEERQSTLKAEAEAQSPLADLAPWT